MAQFDIKNIFTRRDFNEFMEAVRNLYLRQRRDISAAPDHGHLFQGGR